MNEFGRWVLKHHRSMREFAALANVSRQHVHNLSTNAHPPGLRVLYEVDRLTGGKFGLAYFAEEFGFTKRRKR